MSDSATRRRSIPALPVASLCFAGIVCAAISLVPVRAATIADSARSRAPAAKDDKAADAHTAKLKLHVLTDDGKPVGNASVYVRFYTGGGLMHHDKLAELDLKTNQDGTVKVPEIPQGKILIQVIATGWHTFGKWYDVEKDEETIEIKLEPPPHWY